ncbi:MAG: protein kinase [Proteobacteria bacterium]|nr:protein kinase [Pseudomonadota bacterium]
MSSLWRRLGELLRGRPKTQLLPSPESAVVAPPVHLRPEEETWLEGLIRDVGNGERLQALGDDSFWRRIETLWQRGHERLAIEWLGKFLAAPGTPDDKAIALRVRLVEYCDKRGDLAMAVPHLDALTGVDAHATRANYLLAEHYRRQGDEVRALRHYEAVLARDMDYPNVRGRVERLRWARGRSMPGALGQTIAGGDALGVTSGVRYRLIRELGRGATGVVYLARDTELVRDVAVKLLHPHLSTAKRAPACALFFKEARISASLRHPNIIAVLDMDEQARRIVMELASGGTLRTVLRERGPRPLRRALERHAQILSALAAAHRRGIVHRDLKPGNLMFRRDPDEPGAEIVLGDFGVAHLPNAEGATGAAAAADKKPAEAMGTLAYMSPEQRRGARADPRIDLYASAVVLYEMLVGRYPWPRDVLLSGARTRGDFALPGDVTRTADGDLVSLLKAHLDRVGDPDPEGRPDTISALHEARQLRDIALADIRCHEVTAG